MAEVFAAAVTIPLWFPGDLGISLIIGGEKLGEYITNPWLAAAFFGAAVALSAGGSLLGLKIGRELKKAGVLKPRTDSVRKQLFCEILP